MRGGPATSRCGPNIPQCGRKHLTNGDLLRPRRVPGSSRRAEERPGRGVPRAGAAHPSRLTLAQSRIVRSTRREPCVLPSPLRQRSRCRRCLPGRSSSTSRISAPACTACRYAVAKEKGYFKEAGLDVTGFLTSAGGGTTVRNVLASELPYGEVALPAVIAAAQQGLELTIVHAGVASVSDQVWITRKDDTRIKTVQDLEGQEARLFEPEVGHRHDHLDDARRQRPHRPRSSANRSAASARA